MDDGEKLVIEILEKAGLDQNEKILEKMNAMSRSIQSMPLGQYKSAKPIAEKMDEVLNTLLDEYDALKPYKVQLQEALVSCSKSEIAQKMLIEQFKLEPSPAALVRNAAIIEAAKKESATQAAAIQKAEAQKAIAQKADPGIAAFQEDVAKAQDSKLILDILQKAKIQPTDREKQLINSLVSSIHSMKLGAHKSSKDIAQRVAKGLGELLVDHVELQPYSQELQGAFLSIAKKDSVAHSDLSSSFAFISQFVSERTSEPTGALKVSNTVSNKVTDEDRLVELLVDVSEAAHIKKQMGDTIFKEFGDKVKNLCNEYSTAPEANKKDVLTTHLLSLKEWSQEKEEASKAPIFSKIGKVISSYIEAFNAQLIGDKQGYETNMKNAKIVTDLLKVDTKVLTIITEMTGRFANKHQYSREANSKQGNSGHTR